MSFRKAERKKAKLRLALCGPAGSGKTYSALLIAQGLAPEGRIALLDTERGSGELYSDLTPYDVATLTPPFSPERYIDLIEGAGAAGYQVLIIDSLSHAWEGEGGCLELHDRATAALRSGNSYTAWREVTPQHNALVEAMLQSPCHVIATMRSKTAYELSDDGNGKKKPIKVGLAPVQRPGMEYEFTVVLDLSVERHIATATKDRTSLFDGRHWVIETVPHLEDWWRAHRAEIEALMPEDLEALKRHCAARKAAILEALREAQAEREAISHESAPAPAPVATSRRRNGRARAAA
ncbi:MAG: ATP-binding protein [Acidobacteria bacterium]|nr:ATP-binding protein [Acidobacteriota bacterium]